MPSALKNVIDSFHHPTIQPIVGQPSYETLTEVYLKLNTNAASNHLHLGNGQLGLLFFIIAPAIYNTQSNIVFVPFANPCSSPVIPQGLTAAQIADILQNYEVHSDLYTEYDMTDKGLKSLLIAAVDKTYIQSLRDKYIGYGHSLCDEKHCVDVTPVTASIIVTFSKGDKITSTQIASLDLPHVLASARVYHIIPTKKTRPPIHRPVF